MNERIKALMEDSGLYIAYENKAVTERELEYFAETIVKECIACVALIGLSNEEDETVSWTVETSIRQIKNHFEIDK